MPAKRNTKHSESSVKNPEKVTKILVDSIISTIKNSRDKLIFQLLAQTGITPHELIHLKHSDFNFSTNILTVRSEITKNKTERTIGLNKQLCSKIKNFSNDKKQFLFSTTRSIQLTLRTVQRTVEKHSQEFDAKLTSVDLRKYYIIQSLKEKSLSQVKQSAGLKRLDKRKYLSQKEIKDLRSSKKDERETLIFELLLSGIKSRDIVDFKVNDISNFSISDSLSKKMRSFAKKRQLRQHDFIFLTRQNSHLTTERIFQIIKKLREIAGIKVSPRILNNTAIAVALSSPDPTCALTELGLKTSAFHLHGGFIQNE